MNSLFHALNDVLKYTLAEGVDFHRKLIEQPDDVLNSTAYADFLDDHGHPAKAEYIRRAMAQEGNVPLGKVSVQKVGYKPTGPDWALVPIRDGSTVHMRLRLHAGPDRKHLIQWNIPNPDMAELKQDVGPALAAEGVDVPNYLNKSGTKHAIAEHVVRYSADASDFHRAIQAEPTEKTNHLVYADWLDENGQGEAAKHVRDSMKEGGSFWMTPLGHTYLDPEHASFRDSDPGTFLHRPGSNGSQRTVNFVTGGMSPERHYSDQMMLTKLAHDPSQVGIWTARTYHTPDNTAKVGFDDFHLPDFDSPVNEQPTSHTLKPNIYKSDDKPFKYALIPTEHLHPDYQPTGVAPRIGHLLNKIASENTDAGTLAEGIARVGDHSLLKFLADKLADDGHELRSPADGGTGPDLRHAERGIRIDKAVHKYLKSVPLNWADDGNNGLVELSRPSYDEISRAWRTGNTRRPVSRKQLHDAVKKSAPDATRDDIHLSLARHEDNEFGTHPMRRLDAEPAPSSHEPEPWLHELLNRHLEQLGTTHRDAHLYPDTRPANKRYLLSALVAKYKAVKYELYDADSFHNRLVDNRYEQTPALVYADWLQEQGKDAHADLIRSHVQASGRGPLVRTWHSFAGSDAQDNKVSPDKAVRFHDRQTDGRVRVEMLHKIGDRHVLEWSSELLPSERAQAMTDRLKEEAATPTGTTSQASEKYAIHKSPAGGMVNKESNLAVTGSWVQGGQFVNLKPQTVEPATLPSPAKSITLSNLLKKLRARKAG